jgi:hypothetical protein
MTVFAVLLIALVVAVFAAAACMPRRIKDKPWSNAPPPDQRECERQFGELDHPTTISYDGDDK